MKITKMKSSRFLRKLYAAAGCCTTTSTCTCCNSNTCEAEDPADPILV